VNAFGVDVAVDPFRIFILLSAFCLYVSWSCVCSCALVLLLVVVVCLGVAFDDIVVRSIAMAVLLLVSFN